MSKESFKTWAKMHPELATVVLNKNKSWQDFYEIFELYGPDNKVWDNYLKKEVSSSESKTPVTDLMDMVKKIDLNSVQKTVGNLQKTIGLLKDIGIGTAGASATKASNYEPRPLYRHFDD